MTGKDTGEFSWRLVGFECARGAWQMAADLHFYQTIETHPDPVIVRFYRFVPPAVTVGFHQSIDQVVNRRACAAAGIDVVRRPTGGRTLLHRNEINYAVIADTARAAIFGSGLADAFYRISLGVAGGLTRLGLGVEVSGRKRGHGDRPPTVGSGLCAATTTRYEITSHSLKIAAAAQLRSSRKLLQHGTIYVDEPFPVPPEFFLEAKATQTTAMVDLRTFLGHTPEIDVMLQAFREGFAGIFGLNYRQGNWQPGEREGVAQLLAAAGKGTAMANGH